MLTPQQMAQAERKLKTLNEQKQQDEEVKSRMKKFTKTINDAINSIKTQPKRQVEILKNLLNSDFISKIASFQTSSNNLQELQEKLKQKREQLSRQALLMVDQQSRFKKGVEEIQHTIINIKKTVKESVEEQAKKRQKIEDDLEKSLDDIRNKITEFEAESEKFDKENAELQEKVNAIKGKLAGIEDSLKVKAEEKDEEVKAEKEELTNKLKLLEVEVEKATELNKEYAGLQKQNFDNKIALYLKTKKFPQFSSSFQSSANTLQSCKTELLKGVHRMNIAAESIDESDRVNEQVNHLYLVELKRKQEKEIKIEDIKKEKEAVRSHILELQNRLKDKKAKLAG